MRQPTEPERLYLDFDGFFASVEQQARPRLPGKAVGASLKFSLRDRKGSRVLQAIRATKIVRKRRVF